MSRYLCYLLLAAAGTAFADFERPIPAPHTATAEGWFALASVLLCVALYGVHRMIKRR